jgi:hypothetical protein
VAKTGHAGEEDDEEEGSEGSVASAKSGLKEAGRDRITNWMCTSEAAAGGQSVVSLYGNNGDKTCVNHDHGQGRAAAIGQKIWRFVCRGCGCE